jgi:hypothetical protein
MIHKVVCSNLLLWILGTLIGTAAGAPDPAVPLVDPSELSRRTDLIGRMVAVDDRVARFQWHNDRNDSIADRPYDEIYLKRAGAVVFRLPPRLRYETAPRAMAVRIEGVLNREAGQWVCDVAAIELFPSDLERLERAVAALDPRDIERRVGWARWAERRARVFEKSDAKDSAALLERARSIDADAIRIEAEKPSADPPQHWLELARRARQREIPEPEPGALAHRAFAARVSGDATVQDLQTLVKEIEEFWPASPAPTVGGVELDTWLAPYSHDPATTYRLASEPVRAALDHRLWSDATQRLVERRMAAEPEHALKLAQGAATALRDRPLVVKHLLEQGVKEAARNLGALRQGDVVELARVYREDLQQPEAARDIVRRWLDDQRDHRLSATDAEGRVMLAQQYDALLGERQAAVALLQDAWRIDSRSREVADAFRRFDYQKVNDRWIESPRSAGDPADPGRGATPVAAARGSTALRGLTPQEVKARLGGKPDRVNYLASQGQLVEQWIFRGVDQDQYINFLHTPGESLPKVVAYYSRFRPRSDRTRPR